MEAKPQGEIEVDIVAGALFFLRNPRFTWIDCREENKWPYREEAKKLLSLFRKPSTGPTQLVNNSNSHVNLQASEQVGQPKVWPEPVEHSNICGIHYDSSHHRCDCGATTANAMRDRFLKMERLLP